MDQPPASIFVVEIGNEDSMRVKGALFLIICSIFGTMHAQNRKLIDLTYSFSSETIYWPNANGFALKKEFEGMTGKGYFYTANSYSAGEHGGTHMDAPLHFAKGMPAVDQIPLERLFAQAVMIDVQDRAAKNRDYLVNISDIENWEKKNGRIPDGCILLIRTGWGKFYPNRAQYLGTDRRGEQAVAELHFPGIDPAAASWIVKNRKVSILGIDTASIDRGQSQFFEVHQILFKAGICALENVANMDQLPAKGFEVIALPMKIKGGSGAPTRIVAILH
jgi:kynurenine formamidase